jgi:hypothetical protein
MLDWKEDFSYNYYKKMLDIMKNNYNIILISNVETVLSHEQIKPVLFLRHDIDVSVKKALQLAQLEFENNISSTYYFRTKSKFYNINNNLENIRKIQFFGHEIGAHLQNDVDDADREHTLEIKYIEKLLNITINSVSFHKPTTNNMNFKLKYLNRINCYSSEMRERYITDSAGRWRDGEPLLELQNCNKSIQIVTHPIWWGNKLLDANMKDDIILKLKSGW